MEEHLVKTMIIKGPLQLPLVTTGETGGREWLCRAQLPDRVNPQHRCCSDSPIIRHRNIGRSTIHKQGCSANTFIGTPHHPACHWGSLVSWGWECLLHDLLPWIQREEEPQELLGLGRKCAGQVDHTQSLRAATQVLGRVNKMWLLAWFCKRLQESSGSSSLY